MTACTTRPSHTVCVCRWTAWAANEIVLSWCILCSRTIIIFTSNDRILTGEHDTPSTETPYLHPGCCFQPTGRNSRVQASVMRACVCALQSIGPSRPMSGSQWCELLQVSEASCWVQEAIEANLMSNFVRKRYTNTATCDDTNIRSMYSAIAKRLIDS